MKTTGKYKAVLFDLGWTLVKTLDPPEIIRRILETCGVKASLDEIAEVHDENVRRFSVNKMVKLRQKYWINWNMRILERLGIQENKEFYAKKIDELW